VCYTCFYSVCAARTRVGTVMSVHALGLSGLDLQLTTHLHPVPCLRMSGGMPLFPTYSFMAWPRTTLTFCLCVCLSVYLPSTISTGEPLDGFLWNLDRTCCCYAIAGDLYLRRCQFVTNGCNNAAVARTFEEALTLTVLLTCVGCNNSIQGDSVYHGNRTKHW